MCSVCKVEVDSTYILCVFSLAVIFVIDSTKTKCISETHEELAKLMTEKQLKDACC